MFKRSMINHTQVFEHSLRLLKRNRGRPRNSWRRDTEAELKQQGTNWSGMTRAALNRVRWREVVDGLCSTGSDGHDRLHLHIQRQTKAKMKKCDLEIHDSGVN